MFNGNRSRWCAVVAFLTALGLAATVRAQVPELPPLTGKDLDYVRWLEEQSMLFQAAKQAQSVSGHGVQWRHRYGEPQPREAVQRAPVWLLDYPGSVIPRPNKSVLATWGDPELWKTLRDVGIDLLHTGPVNRAGGVMGRGFTPTLDGWFDPIALETDPALGTEDEYRRMVKVAADYEGLIAGDLVPLHTGLGADFRLAQLNYKDYPGMYTMVEVRKDDWGLLPKGEGPWAAVKVPKDAAEKLTDKGYLPGLINSNDAAKDARGWSGWSCTGEVVGVDGKARRWVFLHYFKPTQPTLNWLDPSLAGPRAVMGDLTRTVHGLGARVIRLDAVPFLGLEPKPGDKMTLHYQHPLSITGTNQLAFLTRKLGGWSFHELNIPLKQLKKFTESGPDLSYDFFTRAQVLHALLSSDATLLRQAYGFLQDTGVDVGSLVHDLQNHDEITYQLVELDHRKDETFTVVGEKQTGKELRERMLKVMREKTAGDAAPHNKLYRPEKDGIATTFPGFVAAALGVRDPYNATKEEVEKIKRGHQLLAWANAMQPGVFSLSSWDLVGALPIPAEAVMDRTAEGDWRWVNRGGVDLMGANPEAKASAVGLARAKSLYGPLSEQLKDSESFVSQLKRMLAVRKKHRLAEGELVAVPVTKSPALLVLVMKLPEADQLAVTTVNFGREAVEEEIDLAKWMRSEPGRAFDVFGGEIVVPASGRVPVKTAALTGKTLVISLKKH